MEYATGTDTKLTDGEAPGSKKSKATDSTELAKKWLIELNASKRWMQKFKKAARECEKAYMDLGDADLRASLGAYSGKVNLFWSNVQVLLSAIYGRMPTAEVDRKFNDFQDDVSRVAGIIMQRILNGDIRREHDDTNAAMRDAVQDRFVSGLGQVWCRYAVQTEKQMQPVTDPMTGQPVMDEAGQPVTQEQEVILHEDAETEYVYWDDFLYSPCRRWRECRWVARRVYMSRAKLMERFKLTEEQARMVPTQSRMTSDGGGDSQDDVLRATPYQQAAIWEIWSKDDNYVCWLCEGCSFLLDQVDDPLELDDFFPCPEPIVATTLTKAFLPRPDYAMAQDLYKELDRINARISNLTDAVKAAGVYDKNATAVKSLLTTGVQNALIPAENWSQFTEKNGLKGVVDWLPIEQFVNAISQLGQRKAQIEADLYDVLGISDIMRGTSVASETATAQQLKAQYGGARLQKLQTDVARFVAATMRIRANIIANIFQPETIKQRSLIERTPDKQYADQAIALLKQWGVASLAIDVTSDSLAAPDWENEKTARTEFLGATSNYLMAAGPMVQQQPEIGSFLIQLLQWAAAGFKGAKTIEGVLDRAAAQLEQAAAQPKPAPQPSAEDKKNESAAKKNDADTRHTDAETVGKQLENMAAAATLGIALPPMAPPGGAGMPPPGAGPGGPGPGMPPPGPPQDMAPPAPPMAPQAPQRGQPGLQPPGTMP